MMKKIKSFIQKTNSFNKLLKLFVSISILIGCPVNAQQIDTVALQKELDNRKNSLTIKGTNTEELEKNLMAAASVANQLAEFLFNGGSYERATSLFVEADGYTRQYHESNFKRRQTELKEAEKKLLEYANEENAARRELLLKTGRLLVSVYLSEVIRTANNLDSTEAEEKYLQRLATLAKESAALKDEAEAYEKLGTIQLNRDNPKAAFALYEKALHIRKQIGEPWRTLDYMAYGQWQIGEFAKAVQTFGEEIELLRLLIARPDTQHHTTSPGIEWTEQQKKEMEERQNLIAGLQRIMLRSSLAGALHSLGQLRMAQGKYGAAAEAAKEIETVLSTLETDFGKATDATISSVAILTIKTHTATMLRIRGRIAEAQGAKSEALTYYTNAIKLFSELSAGEPSGAVATLRGRLALLYTAEKKWAEARANIQEVLRLRARLRHQAGTVYGLLFASRIERAAGELEAALKFARQAKATALQLSYAEDILADATEGEADVLLLKANDKNSIQLDQAIIGYRTAVETYRQAGLQPLLARALQSLGTAYEKGEKWKEAEASYKEAIQIIEVMQAGFATKEEGEAFSTKGEMAGVYQRMVDLLARQGRAEQALQYATRAQRSGLIEAIPKEDIQLTGKAAKNLEAVTVAEQKLQKAQTNLQAARTESTSPAQKNQLLSSEGAARQAYALAVKRLEVEQPNLRFTVRPTDLLKLQSTIAPDEAVLSYLVTAEKLYVFVVRKNAVAVRDLPQSQEVLRTQVAKVREGLSAFSDDFYALSFDAATGFAEESKRPDVRYPDTTEHYKKVLAPLQSSLSYLYQQLIAPTEDLLKGVTVIKIIPNAELFLLPFSALISPKDNRYLVEKYTLLHLTAGDLIGSSAKVSKGNLVAFGNPTEADLEGALEEVKAIEKVFPGSKLYTEDAATKQRLFGIKAARILHLATHGHIRSPLENSVIQLAHLEGLEDPDLTYGEIYALPLETTDMVVLSACQTALGTVSGTEVGVFIEAFRTKASTVAASLWSVDDVATRELMTEFYKNLALGKGRAIALRTAQLKLLKNRSTKNPLFWAAFVLYGEGGKLPVPSSTTALKK